MENKKSKMSSFIIEILLRILIFIVILFRVYYKIINYLNSLYNLNRNNLSI